MDQLKNLCIHRTRYKNASILSTLHPEFTLSAQMFNITTAAAATTIINIVVFGH